MKLNRKQKQIEAALFPNHPFKEQIFINSIIIQTNTEKVSKYQLDN